MTGAPRPARVGAGAEATRGGSPAGPRTRAGGRAPSPTGAHPSARRVGPTLRRPLPALGLLVALGAIWEVGVRLADVPAYLLPPPSAVGQAFLRLRADLPTHVVATGTAAVAGLGTAAVTGAVLAVAIAGVGLVRRVLYPLLVVSQTVPMIVLAPLLVAWFGFGLLPKVLVVALVGVFPIVIATVDGIDTADRHIVELVRSLGANRRQMVRHVLVPSALPGFFAGLRIAAAYAMVGAVIAEWMGASAGLGLLLTRSQASFRVDQVLVGIALLATVSIALFGLVGLLGRLATPWTTHHEKDPAWP